MPFARYLILLLTGADSRPWLKATSQLYRGSALHGEAQLGDHQSGRTAEVSSKVLSEG